MANAKILKFYKGLTDEEQRLLRVANKAIDDLNEVAKLLNSSYELKKDGKPLEVLGAEAVPVEAKEATSTLTVEQRRNKIVDCFPDPTTRLFSVEIQDRIATEYVKALNNDLDDLVKKNKLTRNDNPTEAEVNRWKERKLQGKTPKYIYSLNQAEAT